MRPPTCLSQTLRNEIELEFENKVAKEKENHRIVTLTYITWSWHLKNKKTKNGKKMSWMDMNCEKLTYEMRDLKPSQNPVLERWTSQQEEWKIQRFILCRSKTSMERYLDLTPEECLNPTRSFMPSNHEVQVDISYSCNDSKARLREAANSLFTCTTLFAC